MSNREIRIKGTADFSSLKREVGSLNRTINDAFGDGIEIFDKDSIGVMRREVTTAFGKMRDEITKLTKEGKELQKQFKMASGDSKKQEDLSRKQTENVKKQLMATKEMFRLKQSQNTLETGMNPKQKAAMDAQLRKQEQEDARRDNRPGQGRRATRGLNQVGLMASRATADLPGVNQVANVGSSAMHAGHTAKAAGMSTGAMVGLAGLAAAAAAAAFVIGRMAAGFEVYKEGLDDLIKLSGQGVNDLAHDPVAAGRAKRLGFDKLQLLQMQGDMGGAFGAGTDNQNRHRMLGSLTAARGIGMDPNDIFGGADQLRSAGGTGTALKQMSNVLEKAMTSGMDKTQASNYLSAAVGLLSELNQSGAANTGAISNLLADLVAKGQMSPEQAAKTLSGMSGAIAGSSGEANTFFQTAAAMAGKGKGTLMGTSMTTRQGLVGLDRDALGAQVGDTKMGRDSMAAIKAMGLDSKNFTQEYASSILNLIKKKFPGSSTDDTTARMGFTGAMFGTDQAGDQAKILSLLEKLGKGTALSPENEKFLEDVGKDPQDLWQSKIIETLDKNALSTKEAMAGMKNAQFDLGEASSGIFNTLTNAMTELDSTIGELIQFLKDPLGIKDTLFGAPGEPNAASAVLGGLTDQKWGLDSLFGDKSFSPTNKPAFTPDFKGKGTADPSVPSTDVSGVETKLDETNKILRDIGRRSMGGAAPRAGRDTSRP